MATIGLAAFKRLGRFDEQARRTALKGFNIRPRSWWTERRAGLGSMSTQRRANRTAPAIENDCADVRRRWFGDCGKRAGISIPDLRTCGELASYLTAPLMSVLWLIWELLQAFGQVPEEAIERVATNSLLSDHRFETFAGSERFSSSPPQLGTGGSRLSVLPSTHRSSPPRILPVLPSRSNIRRPLPQAPAGEVRWAERYDGKRDLYFQHAA